MRKKSKKKLVLFAIIFGIVLIIYLSCEVRPIEEMKKGFDPKQYARNLWFKLQDILNEGIGFDAVEVLSALDRDPDSAHQRYAKTVGVSNYRYYIVKGVGEIVEVRDEGIIVSVRLEKKFPDLLISNRIFGNSIINATGITKMEDFDRIIDFNLTATELNRIVKEEVIDPFLEQMTKGIIKTGSFVKFVVVFTLLKDEIVRYPIEAVPLRLEIQGGI